VAAATATLAVIRDEGLVESARRVGAIVKSGIEALAKDHDVIGDVRGAGLYIGVELVEDRADKRPSPAAATAVVNALRRRHVLISATGPNANVLKIRPPLVFDDADADRLLTQLRAVLQTVA
jgi:4-aminobutyrate aminotransferase-like enzyme